MQRLLCCKGLFMNSSLTFTTLSASEFWVRERMQDPGVHAWAMDLLSDLCAIDTTLGPDLDTLRTGEQKCFEVFQDAVQPYYEGSHSFDACPLDSGILDDPYYTWPRYAGPDFQDFDHVYKGRKNFVLQSTDALDAGHRWLLHAHVDTVPPHFPVQIKSNALYARGAVDNKSGMAVIALVMRWLSELSKQGYQPLPAVDVAITIDEEAGGNGALSIARNLQSASRSIIVLEPTRLMPHPANRGALWFQVHLKQTSSIAEHTFAYITAEIIKELFLEGRRLREEGVHSLFQPEHVQTCIGIWGHWGTFPASACEQLEFLFHPSSSQEQSAQDISTRLNDMLHNEARRHGLVISKGLTVKRDVGSSSPAYCIQLDAVGGHMGSLARDTDAAIKAAFLISAILDAGLGQISWIDQPPLKIEGGQGFTPKHGLQDIAIRVEQACKLGLSQARHRYSVSEENIAMRVEFEKIHNEAFCSDLNGPGYHALSKASARLCGQNQAPPPQGWQASCDARIFARDCQDVITFGPGALELAHSRDEHIEIQEIVKAAAIVLLAMLEAGAS